MADDYEIRNLDKNTIKNIGKEEEKKLTDKQIRQILIALISYGENYLEQYREGKFLYKKGCVNKDGWVSMIPGRTLLADFDEAEAFNDILLKVRLLKEELNHK
jgi:hypothetical protein